MITGHKASQKVPHNNTDAGKFAVLLQNSHITSLKKAWGGLLPEGQGKILVMLSGLILGRFFVYRSILNDFQ